MELRAKGGEGAFGRGREQAEQWVETKESWRQNAMGGSGGVRSSAMAISSTALISIFSAFPTVVISVSGFSIKNSHCCSVLVGSYPFPFILVLRV